MKTRAKCEPSGGHSLLELMVVLGLIAVLATSAGLAFRGGANSAAALRAARDAVTSALGAARRLAMDHQSPARLLFECATSAQTGGRRLLVIGEGAETGAGWRSSRVALDLPRGIHVVLPVSESASGAVPASRIAGPASHEGISGDFRSAYFIEFDAVGSPAQPSWEIVLAPDRPAGATDFLVVRLRADGLVTAGNSVTSAK